MAADPVLQDTMAMLGLKGRVDAAIDLRPFIRSGLPSAALERMARHLDLSAVATIESLGLAKRTIARRLHEHKPLSSEESERVVRLARVFAEAKHVLGEEAKARRWMQKPSRALGGETPLHLLDTDIGANAVFDELGRIEHGVFA
jgi:putative toxin-antitoxin system antitoxin component (TIGR02293 family)